MTSPFTPIKITTLDDQASHASGDGNLMNLVLKLSDAAPSDWITLFNNAWAQHFYMMKRKARASGSTITVTATGGELEDGLLAELKKVVGQTNEAYSKMYAARQAEESERLAAQRKQADDLTALKKRLDFD